MNETKPTSDKKPRANNQELISIRLPRNLISFIDADVEDENYSSRADWIRSAIEFFKEKRINQGFIKK